MNHFPSRKTLIAALVGVMMTPMAATAGEAELMQKIEALTQQLMELKAQVQAAQKSADEAKATQTKQSEVVAELKDSFETADSKSMEKWLTIGGDYEFRVDSLSGETKPFTNVNATFANAQSLLMGQSLVSLPSSSSAYVLDFVAEPTTNFLTDNTPTFDSTADALTGLMTMGSIMSAVKTYDQAANFVNPTGTINATWLRSLGGLTEAQIASYTAGSGAAIISMKNFMGTMMTPGNSLVVPVAAYKPKNPSMYSNRFGLDLNAKPTDNVTVTAKLSMYKNFGENDAGAYTNSGNAPFFADRVGVFDGTLGHVPSSSYLNVDRAYANWNNIGDQDMWFSVGRRPSTEGAPKNFKNNEDKPGRGGTPALLVDYAFDGMTLGYAPEIDSLPGAYGKICYGRGFESGFSQPTGNSLDDTDMVGVAIVPIDTDGLRVWGQWNRGMNIFDAPKMMNTYFGNTLPKVNLGNIDWLGLGAMGTIKDVGAGKLNWFFDTGFSRTDPNNNVSAQFGFQGLLTGAFLMPEAPVGKTGHAIYTGVRYDLPSKTSFGLEYNYGSKNWITFAPAASDAWTSKVGTRGHVYEAYMIHEFKNKPISSRTAKSFVRLGVQYYDFEYTGSNNWVGAPVAIDSVNYNMMTTTPLDKAYNIYATLNVKF